MLSKLIKARWPIPVAVAIGRLVASHLDVLAFVAGAIIIVMGLHFLGLFKIDLLHRHVRVEVRNHPSGPLGAYVVGLAFAIGWTPCIGPVLAAILAVAGSEQTVTRGAALLAVYSLGLGIPFIVASVALNCFLAGSARVRNWMVPLQRIAGGVLVAIGLSMVTGQFARLTAFLAGLGQLINLEIS